MTLFFRQLYPEQAQTRVPTDAEDNRDPFRRGAANSYELRGGPGRTNTV
jgi:hypothetical protein